MQTNAKIGVIILIALFLIPAVTAEDAIDWYTKGQNAAMNGDYTDAVTYYNNAISLNPSYDAAYAGKAVALNALHQYSDALNAANQALSIKTSNTALGAQADALFYLGQYNNAIAAYQNYTAVVFNQYSAYCNLAYSYVQINSTAQALDNYTKCTYLNPNDPLVWNQIGLLYMNQDQYTNALTAFNKATSITTSNAQIWNDKGLALAALGKYQDAIDCYNTALSLNPQYADAQNNRNAAMGQAQVVTINTTTVATMAPWYLGGNTPTTATPTIVQPIATTESANQQNTAVATQVATTIPVTMRTTFTPLSPFTACLGLIFAIMVVTVLRKQ